MIFKNPQLNLITRNLQEFIGADKLDECLSKNQVINLYWGTAPTGRPHVAYFLPMIKLADFLSAGCRVTVLFADLHAYLDNMKAPWELLAKRTEYYEILIKGMLKSLGVSLERLVFVRGTDYQLSESYTSSVYRIIAMTTVHDATKAGCDVVKQAEDPRLSAAVYPLLQAVDEEFLGVDAQFGGVDQRKIFTFAEKQLPGLGFAKRAHLMTAMIPGLAGGKMSASDTDSKIDLLDGLDDISAKLDRVEFPLTVNQDSNGVLAFIKSVLLPIKSRLGLHDLDNVTDIERDYRDGIIDQDRLRSVVKNGLWKLMENLRDEFRLAGKSDLDQQAYPPPTDDDEPIESESSDNRHEKSIIDQKLEWDEAMRLCGCFDTTRAESEGVVIDRPRVLWTVRATGEPHIGYLVPVRILARLSNCGWSVTVLVEDVGAHLYSYHSSNRPAWSLIRHRAILYRQFIDSAFKSFGGNERYFDIVLGSEFQLSRNYALLFYQSLSHMTERESHDLVSQMMLDNGETVSGLSSVIYPCITALDTLYLRPTARIFGTAPYLSSLLSFTRSLSSHLRPSLPSPVPLFFHHTLVLSLDSSRPMKCPKIGPKTAPKDNSSISMFDNFDTISRKLKKAFFDPKNLSADSSLNILQLLIWPILSQRQEPFVVTRTLENGGDVHFSCLDEIRQQLLDDQMHPGDIKSSLSLYLNRLLITPLTSWDSNAQLFNRAFPSDSNSKSKVKKINSKAFNPNRIDIRLVRVKSITYVSGVYRVQLETTGTSGGLFIMERRDHVFSWTPGDPALVVVTPSRLIGVLCSGDSRSPIRVEKRMSLRPNVVFNRHEPIVPHLKENDESIIVEHIEKNCVINAGGQLEWVPDGSVVDDIDLVGQNNRAVVVVQ